MGLEEGGGEKPVEMIGFGESEGSQLNDGNCQYKLLVNNLAQLSLKRVWNSFFKKMRSKYAFGSPKPA